MHLLKYGIIKLLASVKIYDKLLLQVRPAWQNKGNFVLRLKMLVQQGYENHKRSDIVLCPGKKVKEWFTNDYHDLVATLTDCCFSNMG